MIKYVSHNEIDKEKWDACINQSGTGLIYAYSWYLDIVSPGWDALIMNGYNTVMPLTWSEKWKIKYLYPPLFTQQLGIFSLEPPTEELIHIFMQAIPARFRFIEINLNEYNFIGSHSDCNVRLQANHIIDLTVSYEQLYKAFNRNCKRNINKAVASGMKIRSDIAVSLFVEFVRENLEQQLKLLKNRDYTTLATLINRLLEKNQAEIYAAFTSLGELCGVALFLITRQRCIFSVCASSEQGKNQQAMYLLVNNQIKKYASSGKIFDFSGSNIPGIAYFNSTFGSNAKTYPRFKLNRLPTILKMLKK